MTTTTNLYRISNSTSGLDLGAYQGASAYDAYLALLADAGDSETPCGIPDDLRVEAITFADIHEAMTDLNRAEAPGSECEAYQDFVADCYRVFGRHPDDLLGAAPSADFAAYWLEIAGVK